MEHIYKNLIIELAIVFNREFEIPHSLENTAES
jgi:hypothetical protein